jgi:hypothetical protein
VPTSRAESALSVPRHDVGIDPERLFLYRISVDNVLFSRDTEQGKVPLKASVFSDRYVKARAPKSESGIVPPIENFSRLSFVTRSPVHETPSQPMQGDGVLALLLLSQDHDLRGALLLKELKSEHNESRSSCSEPAGTMFAW